MSRWETVKELVAGVLKGRETELSIKKETPTYARVFFRMAYWREVDHRETVEALNKEGFAVVGWMIHGGGEGLNMELLLVGGES